MEIISITDQPLVSIVVITYNSSKYVLETLESAKAQTYPNIELIISDDCSTDNTVQICREWLIRNKSWFVRNDLITASINSGIPANCNIGAKNTEGIWIKFIAGDDLLAPTCIEEFLKYIFANPQAKIIFSKQQSFTVENGKKILSVTNPMMNKYNEKFYSNNITAEIQYDYLLKRKVSVSGPSYIVSRDLLSAVNYFDERYKLLEDYPMFIRALELGYCFYFIDKTTVYYRIHQESLSFHGNAEKIYPDFFQDWYRFMMNYNFKRINLIYKIDLLFELFFYKTILLVGNRGKLAKIIRFIGHKMTPSKYLRFLRIID